jgi:hypothetical protein
LDKMKTIYLIHAARGERGNDASPEVIAENCRLAILAGKQLKAMLPEYYVYVPHRHENIYQAAIKGGAETIDILTQCGGIVLMADLAVVCSDPKYSEGSRLSVYGNSKSGARGGRAGCGSLSNRSGRFRR